MKFAIVALAAFFFVKFGAADDAVLDLHALGFKLYGRHKPSGEAAPASCPLGTLAANVFFHKTVLHNGVHFTWVKPVHGLVKEVKCDAHAVWKGHEGELLLDLHFFGHVKAKMFVHVEHLTAHGGVAHAFLRFAADALKGEALGLVPFVTAVAGLVGSGFLNVKALPAHELLHHLAGHFAAL